MFRSNRGKHLSSSGRLAAVRAAALLASACSALGCSDDAPQGEVTIVVEADPEVAASVESLRVRLYSSDSQEGATPERTLPISPRAGGAVFPARTAFSADGKRSLLIVIEGLSAGETRIVQKVEARLEAGLNQRVAVYLGEACLDAELCDSLGSSCYATAQHGITAGSCGPVPTAQAQLFQHAHVVDAGSDAGDASDAEVDAAPAPLPAGYVACAQTGSCPAQCPCLEGADGGYTCAGQYADWPMPNSVAEGGRGHLYAAIEADEVTIDRVTGLLWQRKLPALYPGCTAKDTVSGDSCSWQEAKAYCAQLKLAGKSWRLPSRVELLSLIDLPHADLAMRFYPVDALAFPSPLSRGGAHWSSTAILEKGEPFMASQVFLLGALVSLQPLDHPGLVRCVHSSYAGQARPETRFKPNTSDGTIVDTRTGLEWERAVPQQDLTQAAAVARCEGLGRGFRVPSLPELFTLYSGFTLERQLDPIFPTSNQAAVFWSSDVSVLDKKDPMVLLESIAGGVPASMIADTIAELQRTSPVHVGEMVHLVRCVRPSE